MPRKFRTSFPDAAAPPVTGEVTAAPADLNFENKFDALASILLLCVGALCCFETGSVLLGGDTLFVLDLCDTVSPAEAAAVPTELASVLPAEGLTLAAASSG